MRKIIVFILMALLLNACTQKKDWDASGHFEADEVIVSAQQNGLLVSYAVAEGAPLRPGEKVGQIDVRMAELQKEEVLANIDALSEKTVNADDQLEWVRRRLDVQQAQLTQLLREQMRTQNLVDADAATRKQLDDVNAAVDQLKKQMAVTKQQLRLDAYNVQAQNRSIMSGKDPLEKSVARIQEQIDKGEIVNPIAGTVLVNYALAGEFQVVGKPLYKVANTDTLYLRAYITGSQLPEVRLDQAVGVRIDQGEKAYKYYEGKITWISSKSEFTPKTIQTKDERANLVYAIKVAVKNDGYLKIGMYGEVLFKEKGR